MKEKWPQCNILMFLYYSQAVQILNGMLKNLKTLE